MIGLGSSLVGQEYSWLVSQQRTLDPVKEHCSFCLKVLHPSSIGVFQPCEMFEKLPRK
jgi:hypothetical protein